MSRKELLLLLPEGVHTGFPTPVQTWRARHQVRAAAGLLQPHHHYKPHLSKLRELAREEYCSSDRKGCSRCVLDIPGLEQRIICLKLNPCHL